VALLVDKPQRLVVKHVRLLFITLQLVRTLQKHLLLFTVNNSYRGI